MIDNKNISNCFILLIFCQHFLRLPQELIMLQQYLILKNYTNRLPVHRYYTNFDKLLTRQTLSKPHKSPTFNQSRHYQCVNQTAKIESQFHTKCINLTKWNGLILRRNFCTKPNKKFDRSWSAIRKQQQESKKEIRRLFSLAKDEKWYIFAAIGCLFVSSAVTLGVPRAIGKIMDMIVKDNFPKDKLHTFCLLLFSIFAIGGLANFGRIYMMNSASK